MFWRVYGNLRLRCPRSCGWSGDIVAYGDHLSSCCSAASAVPGPAANKAPAVPSSPSAVSTTSPATPSAPSAPVKAFGQDSKSAPLASLLEAGAEHEVVWDHHSTAASQLSLRKGDRVSVQQVAAHGWVYGTRLSPGTGSAEGWFPTFCLPEQRPPRPQQAPPPSAPPEGATEVTRDYEASDPAQLSLKEGELVYVRQRDLSGWTLVVRVSNVNDSGKREGWVPHWLLSPDSGQ